jgi:hypothetical protein
MRQIETGGVMLAALYPSLRTHREQIALLLWGALVGALFFGVVLFAWVAWVLWST